MPGCHVTHATCHVTHATCHVTHASAVSGVQSQRSSLSSAKRFVNTTSDRNRIDLWTFLYEVLGASDLSKTPGPIG